MLSKADHPHSSLAPLQLVGLPPPLSVPQKLPPSLGPFPPLLAPFSDDSCCGQVGHHGWGCRQQGPTPQGPTASCTAGQTLGAQRCQQHPGSLPDCGGGISPQAQGEGGTAGVYMPWSRDFRNLGSPQRGMGRMLPSQGESAAPRKGGSGAWGQGVGSALWSSQGSPGLSPSFNRRQ